MDLVLFIVFLALSLILIIVGLFKAEHTELSIVGFVFLFLLSMTVIAQDIQYKVGYDINTTNNYTLYNVSGEYFYGLTSSIEISTDRYDTFTAGSDFSHNIGYWLAIASIIGFIGVLLSMRKSKGF